MLGEFNRPELIQLAEPPASDATSSAGLELTDLLNDVDTLGGLLAEQIRVIRSTSESTARSTHVLDAFLLAVGINQVADDYVHRSFPLLDAFTRRGGPAAASVSRRLRRALETTRYRSETRIDQWRMQIENVVAALADAVAMSTPLSPDTGALADSVALDIHRMPYSLRRSILRLPDCFRGYDQQPDDCRRLSEEFLQRWPDRSRHLLVVGVRTSGSYLAPLQAAYLSRAGCAHVTSLTIRPGQTWSPREQAHIRDLHKHGGLALLIDDPPITGGKLEASARALEHAGLPSESIVLLVPLLGTPQAMPNLLRPRQTVSLPWRRWAVRDSLGDSPVLETLRRIMVGRKVGGSHCNRDYKVADVESVEQLELPPIMDLKARPMTRSHLRAGRRVQVRDEAGVTHTQDVYIKGTGLGYFGRHSVAVAKALKGLIPEVYGWENGLLFRSLHPEQARLSITMDTTAATAIVQYVISRSRSLSVPEDKSLRLRRRRAAWEVTAELLAAQFGRWRWFAAHPLKRFVRRATCTANPCVIDGSTALPHWFITASNPTTLALAKADYDERAFSVWDLYSYDPVMDLAMTAADFEFRYGIESADFGDLLRSRYERSTGKPISPERWYLHTFLQLMSAHLHFQRLARDGSNVLQGDDGAPPAEQTTDPSRFAREVAAHVRAGEIALTRIHNRYVSHVYSADLARGTGPRCAVDGAHLVAPRSRRAGWLSRDGALELRALVAHGYRIEVVCSGSSPALREMFPIFDADAGPFERGKPSEPVAQTLTSRADAAALLGHQPGACRSCRVPAISAEAEVLLNTFDAADRSALGTFGALMRLLGAERSAAKLNR